MRSFGRWFAEQGTQEVATARPADNELPEGLSRHSDGKIYATCCACDKAYEWDIDPSEGFDQDMSYCGGSERCCP